MEIIIGNGFIRTNTHKLCFASKITSFNKPNKGLLMLFQSSKLLPNGLALSRLFFFGRNGWFEVNKNAWKIKLLRSLLCASSSNKNIIGTVISLFTPESFITILASLQFLALVSSLVIYKYNFDFFIIKENYMYRHAFEIKNINSVITSFMNR